MVHYRRNRIEGGTFFFTVTLLNRRSKMLVEHNELLRQSFRATRDVLPFKSHAFVILPDHLHVLWTLPGNDDDYPARWRSIKSHFVRLLKKSGVCVPANHRGEHSLWQKRYWEHTIRNDEDMKRHIDYIHYNPVKHGYVMSPDDWGLSSFHHYVRSGLLPHNWVSAPKCERYSFGE